jgi:hypothetical protein
MMGELIRHYGDGLIGKQFAYRLVSPMIAHKPRRRSAPSPRSTRSWSGERRCRNPVMARDFMKAHIRHAGDLLVEFSLT